MDFVIGGLDRAGATVFIYPRRGENDTVAAGGAAAQGPAGIFPILFKGGRSVTMAFMIGGLAGAEATVFTQPYRRGESGAVAVGELQTKDQQMINDYISPFRQSKITIVEPKRP